MASLCLGPANTLLLFNTNLLFYYYLQYLMRSELPLCCDHGRLSYGNPATLLASACLTSRLQAHYRTSTGDCVFMVPLGDWNNKFDMLILSEVQLQFPLLKPNHQTLSDECDSLLVQSTVSIQWLISILVPA
ncbi:hypothetical protein HZ326_15402 [Fusarium oxysporum f. sp. albedinis]|nr:hypothetical protein HZ326_15402 [Fusarium oxysporum f. sp. albedinis]